MSVRPLSQLSFPSDNMEVVPASRKGCVVYKLVDGNFLYRYSWSKGDVRYYKCRHSHCGSRAVSSADLTNVSVNGAVHNHGDDSQEIAKLRAVGQIKTAVTSHCGHIREIFNNERRRNNIAVPYSRYERTLQRTRRMNTPPVSSSAENFVLRLNETPRYRCSLSGESFFVRFISDENTGSSVLFISPRLRGQLERSHEIYVDATFKIVPRLFYQLCTIFFRKYDSIFGAAFALMERKSKASYVSLFRALKEELPNLEPDIIITDYEKALQNTMVELFENADVHGCWFHYAKAVWGKVQNIGLQSVCRSDADVMAVVRKYMVIPLLPADRFTEAFEILKEEISLLDTQTSRVRRQLYSVHDYVIRTWTERYDPSVVSVYGQVHRTNNGPESFHSQLLKKFGGAHVNEWTFMEKLLALEDAEAKDFQCASTGEQIRRNRRRKYVLQDKRIRDSEEKLSSGRYTVGDFLAKSSYAVAGMTGVRQVNSDDNELEGCEAENAVSSNPNTSAITSSRDEPQTNSETPHSSERSTLCVVCLDGRREYLFLPCRHFVACEACTNILIGQESSCPTCRSPIDSAEKIFM